MEIQLGNELKFPNFFFTSERYYGKKGWCFRLAVCQQLIITIGGRKNENISKKEKWQIR